MMMKEKPAAMIQRTLSDLSFVSFTDSLCVEKEFCPAEVTVYGGKLFKGRQPELFYRQQFIFFLLQTFRAHAVGGFGVEFGVEISFHRQPFAIVAHPAAPAADAQVFFEMMQAHEQAARQPIYPKPNRQNDDRAQDGAVPARREPIAKKIFRDMNDFGEP